MYTLNVNVWTFCPLCGYMFRIVICALCLLLELIDGTHRMCYCQHISASATHQTTENCSKCLYAESLSPLLVTNTVVLFIHWSVLEQALVRSHCNWRGKEIIPGRKADALLCYDVVVSYPFLSLSELILVHLTWWVSMCKLEKYLYRQCVPHRWQLELLHLTAC